MLIVVKFIGYRYPNTRRYRRASIPFIFIILCGDGLPLNDMTLCGPVAKIYELATLRAKGPEWVGFGPHDNFIAGGTVYFQFT